MNYDIMKSTITSGLMAVLSIAGGYLIGKGYVKAEDWAQIAPAIAAIFGIIWYKASQHTDSAFEKKVEAKLPDIEVQSSPASPPAITKSHWLASLVAVLFLAPMLGGCFYTLSNGTQVVLDAKDLPQIVADLAKKTCSQYNANKVTDQQVLQVATGVINSAAVTTAVSTVEFLVSAVCPLIAPPAPVTVVPPVVAPAPAVTPAG